MANLILCAHHEAGAAGSRFLDSVRERFPDVEQENHDDLEALCDRLCLPGCGGKEEEIVIVFVDNRMRLERLIELKGCLDGRRLALVLHEVNREILSRTHLLRPRYVSCGKSQVSDLLSVLEKMINTPGEATQVGTITGEM